MCANREEHGKEVVFHWGPRDPSFLPLETEEAGGSDLGGLKTPLESSSQKHRHQKGRAKGYYKLYDQTFIHQFPRMSKSFYIKN